MLRSRLVLTLMTPVAQVFSAMVLALVLSQWGGRSDSGWGDLIGVVIGIIVGAGVGVGAVLTVVARRHRRSIGAQGGVFVVAVPSALVVASITGAMGIDFWLAAVVYLAGSMFCVWWYAGRTPT